MSIIEYSCKVGDSQGIVLTKLRNAVFCFLSMYSQNNSDTEDFSEGAHAICIVKMLY